MSNTPDERQKPKKRGYKVGGVNLACDVRVRITVADSERLTQYAQEHEQTRAEAARTLLHDALNPDEK